MMQLLRSSPEALEDHAQGLLLGLALGELAGGRRGDAVQELPVVNQVLVVAEILATGRSPDPASLLAGWAALPRSAHPGSVSAEAVTLYEGGLPVEEVAIAVARVLPDRSGDAPLTSCLPFALACHGSGAAIKAGARRCAAVTHASPTSQLAAIATAMLARDLMILGLPDCLARVSQAVRTEASRDLLAALHLPEPGEGLPEGDDAISLLAATVQSLAEGQDWEESTATATSRSAPGDRLPALVGALAGGRCGLGALPTKGRDLLPRGLEEHLCGLAVQLVRIGAGAAAAGPLPAGGPAA
jgi:ADP-ribosylglycohydrolase